jgi:hypothetical protein
MCFLKLIVILVELRKVVTLGEYESLLEVEELIKLIYTELHALLDLVESGVDVYVVMELIKGTQVSILIHMLMIAIQAHRQLIAFTV